MGKKQKNLSYEQLKKDWYKKLEESGFKDIEDDLGLLKDWDSLRFKKSSSGVLPEQMEMIRDHYTRATHLLHEYHFPSLTHRIIWTGYSDGLTLDEIVKQLSKTKHPLKRSQVHKIISQYLLFIK